MLPGTHDLGTYVFDKTKGALPNLDLTVTIQENYNQCDRPAFFKKALTPMVITPFAITIVAMDLQAQKALLPVVVVTSGIVT